MSCVGFQCFVLVYQYMGVLRHVSNASSCVYVTCVVRGGVCMGRERVENGYALCSSLAPEHVQGMSSRAV